MTDRTALIGLFILAGLAWVLPDACQIAADALRPSATVLYAEQSDGEVPGLVWSPSDPVEAPLQVQGHILSVDGRPHQAVPGWRGLLLGKPLDLNQASQEDLQALPKVGPKTAAAILETRGARGRFDVVEDLLDVPGIGPKTLERLRPWVRVGLPTE